MRKHELKIESSPAKEKIKSQCLQDEVEKRLFSLQIINLNCLDGKRPVGRLAVTLKIGRHIDFETGECLERERFVKMGSIEVRDDSRGDEIRTAMYDTLEEMALEFRASHIISTTSERRLDEEVGLRDFYESHGFAVNEKNDLVKILEDK